MAVDFIRMIRDDMDLFHDGPSGVLEVLNGWGSGAQTPAANAKPSGWSAYVMWGHLMRDATGAVASLSPTDAARPWRDSRTRTGNRASNTRVQLNHQQIVWLLSNGSWQLGEYRNWLKPVLYPFNWTEGTEINMPLPNYRQTEPLGGSSMRALSLANDSRNPANPNQYRDRTWHPFGDRQVVPANFVGWVSCFFGRLIVDDPLLPDDRAQANLLGGCAHDWYLAMDLGGVPPTAEVNVTNAGWSRLKYLTNDWQLFAHTNLSESTLRGNPPPLTGLSLLEPTAVPANTRIFPATVARSVAQAVSSAGAGGCGHGPREGPREGCARGAAGACASGIFTFKVKHDPAPRRLLTDSSPPMACARPLEMASPRPLPRRSSSWGRRQIGRAHV